tara:strand:+ start:260 stop:508 length:249 start_codon:yes stop_codon:yes gene_type:complete
MGNKKNNKQFLEVNSKKENISGWILTTSFGSSVISGLLVGLLVEYFFEINPYGVIIGIILGSINGYYRLWVYSKRLSDERRS